MTTHWYGLSPRTLSAPNPYPFRTLLDGVLADIARTAPATSATNLATNVFEDDDGIVLEALVPGLRAEDLEVELDDGVLIVRGERAETHAEEDVAVQRRERHALRFDRRFTLPRDADAERVEADLHDGILTLRIGKRDRAAVRRIAIAAD